MNHENKRPITLEDLLHLKRAERPPAEFWTRFEQDLRAKQLAALVDKRPWWRTMPRLFAGFSRYHLPLGATAILALTFLSVRDYQAVARVEPASAAKRIEVAPAASAPVLAVVAPTADPLHEFVAAPRAPDSGDLALVAAPPASMSELADHGSLNHAVALLESADNSTLSVTPSARSIAANFAVAQAANPDLARRFLGAAHGFEERVMPARSPAVEPLAQMTTPADARRSRFVAAAAPVSLNTIAGGSEKIARRISDDRLYDTVSRFDARGDRFKLKF